jgi:hypothetical protein
VNAFVKAGRPFGQKRGARMSAPETASEKNDLI